MSKPVVYTKPACVQCNGVIRFLEARGVEYETRSLLEDPEALQSFIDRGFSSAPITVWGDRIIAGFNDVELREALADSGS